MTLRCNEKSRHRSTGSGWAFACAVLVCAVPGVFAAPRALASEWGAGHGRGRGDVHGQGARIFMHTGNGRFNKTFSTVFGPTENHGLQQIANTNLSGQTNTQAGVCVKRRRSCNIWQAIGGW